MRRSYIALPAKTRRETFLSAVLAVGILAMLIIPAQPFGAARGSGTSAFQVMEEDYLQPKLVSARQISALNRAGGGLIDFGGYDEITGAVATPNRRSVSNVTRYAGQLFGVLGVEFILRERARGGRRVFLSEHFWETEFGRSATALGQAITINGLTYRVAGVIRHTSGFLANTELWLPACGRGLGSDSACLRIIGGTVRGTNWKKLWKMLLANTAERSEEWVREVMANPRLLPLERGLQVAGPEMNREMIAISSDAVRTGDAT